MKKKKKKNEKRIGFLLLLFSVDSLRLSCKEGTSRARKEAIHSLFFWRIRPRC